MEPLSDVVVETIFKKGIKRSKKQLQPYRTVIVDLNLSEEDLLSRMHHKTRYNIKVADKHGLTVKLSSEVDAFWKLLEKTSKRDKFYSHTKGYYKKLLDTFNGARELKTELLLAYYENKPVAGAIVLRYGDTGYYLHGASDHESRAVMAPYALHWNIMAHLKESGLHYYDLWGIDARRWPGVTRFKLGWDGDMKEYPGSFDLVISKFWYFIYNLARKIHS
jgi:lipid II:glycine glycyltransferase (peptidoglycan interpeptide bridge formation enzyme)